MRSSYGFQEQTLSHHEETMQSDNHFQQRVQVVPIKHQNMSNHQNHQLLDLGNKNWFGNMSKHQNHQWELGNNNRFGNMSKHQNHQWELGNNNRFENMSKYQNHNWEFGNNNGFDDMSMHRNKKWEFGNNNRFDDMSMHQNKKWDYATEAFSEEAENFEFESESHHHKVEYAHEFSNHENGYGRSWLPAANFGRNKQWRMNNNRCSNF